MSSTLPSFDIPAHLSSFILESADASILREAMIREQSSVSGVPIESARASVSALLSQLDDAALRMLALETVAMNNSPNAAAKTLKVDRGGYYLLSDKGITQNKSLSLSGHDREI